MSEFVKFLTEIDKESTSVAGGKGANLGEMIQQGFPVPSGFVVCAKAYEDFFQNIDLGEKLKTLEANTDELESECQSVKSQFEKINLSESLAQEIMVAHDTLQKSSQKPLIYAVRSSATAEDLKDASFAGQHGTYYYITKEQLLKMIKNCWISLWNTEAVSYRITQGIEHSSVFMAVVVQEMVPSEISGITFTANPVTGAKDEIIIESSWGMGAAIVDGRVVPDHYVVERENLELRRKRIAKKKFMIPSSPTGKTRLQEVPYEMKQKETLSIELLGQVAMWAIKAEQHFKSPQDIEWAIVNDNFYMLQSRPITVMGREEISKGVSGRYILFKPIIENFTDPLTPLGVDMMYAVKPPPAKFIKMVRGWLYINFDMVKKVFPLDFTDEQMVNFVYSLGFSKASHVKIAWRKLPSCMTLVLFISLINEVIVSRVVRLPDDFMDIFRDLCQRVVDDPNIALDDAFRKLWVKFNYFDPIGYQVVPINLAAGRYMFFLVAVQKLLKYWIPDIDDNAEKLLCSGGEGVLSANMGRGIWALAKKAKSNAKVQEILINTKQEKMLSNLKAEPEAQEFISELDSFLAKNGHRALKELEMKSVRWEENPAPVLGMVRNYLLMDTNPEEHEKQTDQKRQKLREEIQSKLKKYPIERFFKLRWHFINFFVKRARFFAKLRENSRFYHIMGFYAVRKKILKIEAELIEQGKLRCKDDIFYLGRSEIVALQKGELLWLDVEERIRERRIEHIRLSKMMPPKTIGVELPKKPAEEDSDNENIFCGQGASPGVYEGVANVILDPAIDLELKPGEILVAPYTDPAWTPLFLTAGAAVVEVGSYLSHAGTVAREFGMPCVVDVPECTKFIQTGMRIKVNGEKGTVRVISRETTRIFFKDKGNVK